MVTCLQLCGTGRRCGRGVLCSEGGGERKEKYLISLDLSWWIPGASLCVLVCNSCLLLRNAPTHPPQLNIRVYVNGRYKVSSHAFQWQIRRGRGAKVALRNNQIYCAETSQFDRNSEQSKMCTLLLVDRLHCITHSKCHTAPVEWLVYQLQIKSKCSPPKWGAPAQKLADHSATTIGIQQ